MNIKVYIFKKRLDSLFKKISILTEDIELQSHWSNYLCILSSGFIESSIQIIFNEYAAKNSNPFISNYVENNIKFFQNPKMSKIIELTNSFNPEWGKKLENYVEGELKDSVDSIVANRNNISHGQNVNISYVAINKYYQNALKVIDYIEQLSINSH